VDVLSVLTSDVCEQDYQKHKKHLYKEKYETSIQTNECRN